MRMVNMCCHINQWPTDSFVLVYLMRMTSNSPSRQNMQLMRSTEEMALQAKTRTKLTCKNRNNHTTLANTQHTH